MIRVATSPDVIALLLSTLVVLTLQPLHPRRLRLLDLGRVRAGGVLLQQAGIDLQKGLAVRERREHLLGPVRVAADVKGRGQGLDAVEPPGLAVVDRVGGDEVGQQPLAPAAHLGPGHLLGARPGALDDGGAVGVHELAVGGRDDELAVGGDDDAVVALAHVQVAHEAELHELLARAPLGVAVAEVPAGGLEGGAARGGGGRGVVVVAVVVAGAALARIVAMLVLRATTTSSSWMLALGGEVFLVPNHGSLCVKISYIAAVRIYW